KTICHIATPRVAPHLPGNVVPIDLFRRHVLQINGLRERKQVNSTAADVWLELYRDVPLFSELLEVGVELVSDGVEFFVESFFLWIPLLASILDVECVWQQWMILLGLFLSLWCAWLTDLARGTDAGRYRVFLILQ